MRCDFRTTCHSRPEKLWEGWQAVFGLSMTTNPPRLRHPPKNAVEKTALHTIPLSVALQGPKAVFVAEFARIPTIANSHRNFGEFRYGS
jgi:hypothetical protein